MLRFRIKAPQLLNNLLLGGYGLLTQNQKLQQLALLQVQLHFLTAHRKPQIGRIQLQIPELQRIIR
ncbi:hypothetical protein D3C80_2039660 [compost metagenome]